MTEHDANLKLADLADRYWQFECDETPFPAILAGQTTRDNTLFREAAGDYDRRYEKATSLLKDAIGISESGLSPQQRATRRLLERELSLVCKHYELDGHFRASIFPAGPAFNSAFFANSTKLLTLEDARIYLERLKTLPTYFNDISDNLIEGINRGYNMPEFVLSRTALGAKGYLNEKVTECTWYAPFKTSPIACSEKMIALAGQAELIIADKILPSLRRFIETLETTLSAKARRTISCTSEPRGREYYSLLVSQFTSLDYSAGEIHTIGLQEVARLNTRMDEIARDLGHGGAVELRKVIADDPNLFSESKDVLRAEIECLSKRIDRKIPEFFRRIPRITYGVELIPEKASEDMPAAYAQPSPADGSNAGIFWLTSLVEKAPRFIHAALTLHEAWPGHLMHIALLQEMDNLPAFRRFGAIKYTACVEGWALYCESLGREMGFYDEPLYDFGRLDMEMFRAVRLVVDTGIHWYGWTRDQAIDYMLENLTHSRSMIESEVDRYIALPGQALAYQIGNLKIRELRNRAEDVLGESFALRNFHEVVMTAGAVTLPVLEDLVNAWIDDEVAALAEKKKGHSTDRRQDAHAAG